MGHRFLLAASLAALMTGATAAQQSSQAVPDAPQPQTQKKPAPKPDPKDAKPLAKDDNAFPEDVSKAAAKAATGDANSQQTAPAQDPAQPAKPDAKPPAKDDNAFPEDVSKAAAAKAAGADSSTPQQNAPAGGQHSTSADNPFPEDQSKAAAKAAGNDTEAMPARPVTPGVSSSSSSSLENIGPAQIEPDPGRSKKDAEVGGFYLKQGNYQGALQRYQDATTYDATNVDAIFGLAETQRMLRKNTDAAKNYQMYLDIVPNGPKSKQAMKALKELGSGG
jgi:hypothetical protein